MPIAAAEKTNFPWQLEQLQRRIGEWWELQTIQLGDRIPNVPGFGWIDPQVVEILAKLIFWVLLGLILIWLALKLVRFLEAYLQKYQTQTRLNTKEIKGDRPSQLPVNIWLAKAQEFRHQGNYKEACFCIYQAMLQHLSDSAIIANEFSRTDGEYLKLTKYLDRAKHYQKILQIHQKLCFSEAEAKLDTFEECQQAYQQIAQ